MFHKKNIKTTVNLDKPTKEIRDEMLAAVRKKSGVEITYSDFVRLHYRIYKEVSKIKDKMIEEMTKKIKHLK